MRSSPHPHGNKASTAAGCSSASHALVVVLNILPQMAWNEPHGTLGPKYVLNSWAWWYYPDILALVSPFITLLSCFTACSISIIAIIRRWLTKWPRCRCNVSPSDLNRTFCWATRRLEQSFVMTGLQGETSLPNFSRTRSNPQTAKCMRIAHPGERLSLRLRLSPRKRAVWRFKDDDLLLHQRTWILIEPWRFTQCLI